MGKLITFDVLFANQTPVFYSGQSVNGTVIVNLRDAMKMRGIRARIYGRAYTRVVVHRTRSVSDGQGGSRTESYTETHVDWETYLDSRVTLWGKEVGHRQGENPVLPAGRYDLNFNFVLPPHLKLPSSFEGPNCNIRYMIIANIDKPWKFDHVSKRAFTLLESIDINDPSFTQRPFPLQNEKFLCCCCCKSGPLKLTASIDRSGYCPGEGILLNAECQNLTNRKMGNVRARLLRYVSWTAHGHSESSSNTYFEIKSPGQIEEGQTFNWDNQLIQIPALPPSITSCSIIRVYYEFQVSVVVPRGINLHVMFPITLGTIPLRQQFAPQPMVMQPPGAQPPPPGAQLPPPGAQLPPSGAMQQAALPATAPPCYQQCIDGRFDIKENDDSDYLMGERSFAPMYTYATNFQTPQPQPYQNQPPMNPMT